MIIENFGTIKLMIDITKDDLIFCSTPPISDKHFQDNSSINTSLSSYQNWERQERKMRIVEKVEKNLQI
jgi:hypothetical protein